MRFDAADFACWESASGDAAECPSFFSAAVVALERVRETLFFAPCAPALLSASALCRVASEAVPFLGAGTFTPARRASESPIAIACLADRAPCFPSLTCSISWWTNSPAWVLGALPSLLSFLAFSIVFFSGMTGGLLSLGVLLARGNLNLKLQTLDQPG